MYNYRLGLDGTNDEVTVIAGNSFEEEEHAFCLSEFLEAATCPSGIIKLLGKGSYQNVTYWYYWGGGKKYNITSKQAYMAYKSRSNIKPL